MTEPEAPPITEAMHAPAAARAAEEALRQAVHASWSGIGTAADVYAVFGAVNYSLELLPQLLDQLTAWLEKHHHELQATDDGPTTPGDRIADLRTAVTSAVEALDSGRERLAGAQSILAPLYGPLPRDHG
jgi:hypothetical protein